MVAQLANKLTEINCEFTSLLKSKVDQENYGLRDCSTDLTSDLDKNPKYQKLKKDFITYYNKFNINQLLDLKNECDVLKIIKKL